MRKILLLTAMALCGFGQASAQNSVDDLGIFNHFSVGVGLGTTGITVEAAAPITPYVAVRGGVNIFPNVKMDVTLDVSELAEVPNIPNFPTLPKEMDVEGKLSMTTGHVLFDLFPLKSSSLHLTVGAYFGSDKIVSVYNKEDGALSLINDANKLLDQYEAQYPGTTYRRIGLELGDYLLTPDEHGNVEASLKVASFRPYLGIGFGRPVPMKHRLAFNCDLGVQFWGSPKVYLQDKQLTEDNLDSDSGDILKTISKISVYPSVSFRLVGRIL